MSRPRIRPSISVLLATLLWAACGGPTEPAAPAAPLVFPESRRLHVRAVALPPHEMIPFRVALPPEALGNTPRPVRVSSTAGRYLETEGAIALDPDNEVRFELERDWLEPGTYLIQITTAEKGPLPLRRFVLQVE